jgi:uncharacterized membrane protein
MIIFWILLAAMVFWYLGALVFVYHVFSFRYPKDITIGMLILFLALMGPVSLVTIGYLADLYGGNL